MEPKGWINTYAFAGQRLAINKSSSTRSKMDRTQAKKPETANIIRTLVPVMSVLGRSFCSVVRVWFDEYRSKSHGMVCFCQGHDPLVVLSAEINESTILIWLSKRTPSWER